MPVIKINDQQYALSPGQNRLGGGSGVEVPINGDANLGVQAVVEVGRDGKAVIRRSATSTAVRVNGVALGVEPTPLIHGDKVEIAGRELFFADDAKSGATQFVSASDIAAIAAKRSGPARATSATGGRLVSLVDGKEYTIPSAGATIGREATCDIVVAQSEVSRKHAMVSPAEDGYVVKDLSANGLFVNGAKVNQQQVLARSDVIRIGTEEFRFYADVKAAPKGSPAAGTPPAPAPAAPVAPVSRPAAAAPTPHVSATPIAASPAAPPPAAPAAPAARPASPPQAAPPSPPASAPPRAPAAGRSEAMSTPLDSPPVRPTPPTPARRVAPAAAAAKPSPASTPDARPKGGVPSWLWTVVLLVLLIGAAAAYFILGAGR